MIEIMKLMVKKYEKNKIIIINIMKKDEEEEKEWNEIEKN